MFSTVPSTRAFNQSFQTFNTLNAYILKGDGAQGMGLTFAPLMVRAGDEPDAMYGLVAKSVRISADGLTYRFTLRPEARFHDGSRLTAQGRRVLADDAEGQGPSDHHPADARHGDGGGDGRRHAGGDLRAEARAATCRCSSPGCRSSRRPTTPSIRSTNRRWRCRSAAAPTRSAASRSGATSNSTASRIGGAPNLPVSARRTTISTSCGSISIATATSPSRASPDAAICIARSSPRGSGTRATISRRSRTAGSSARRCRTTRRPARRAGSSTPAATSSRIRGCARRSATRSISNGPTRPSCTAPMRARCRRSRIPT